MIRNDYICELDLKFDTEYLSELIQKSKRNKHLAPHQFEINDDPYLSAYKKLYPFLSPIFNIYIFPPNRILPVHIDAARKVALNIPISGTEESLTSFYKSSEDMVMDYVPQKVLYRIDQPLEKVFEFSLRQSTLINNSIPHGVINGSKQRTIISWSIVPQYSFEDIVQWFDNCH